MMVTSTVGWRGLLLERACFLTRAHKGMFCILKGFRWLTNLPYSSISAYLPPTLLHNLHLEPSASLKVSPARLSSPSFPTAYSVTVARIASPHSVNRAYQSLFLEGLKEYFQSHRRVLKKGDIIAVGICEDTARFTEGKADDDDVE